MPELKPCPFCGNKVVYGHNLDGIPHGVYCRNCHMRAQWSNIIRMRKTTAGQVAEQIADKWNRRVSNENKKDHD